MDGLLPFADLIKISEEDIETLFPGEYPGDFARQCLGRGTGLVVVTKGADGAVAFGSFGMVEVPSVQVDVVDAVGAGDSFQAALLCGLEEMGALSSYGLKSLGRKPLEALLKFAAGAAALTCSRRGADLPKRSELSAPDWDTAPAASR